MVSMVTFIILNTYLFVAVRQNDLWSFVVLQCNASLFCIQLHAMYSQFYFIFYFLFVFVCQFANVWTGMLCACFKTELHQMCISVVVSKYLDCTQVLYSSKVPFLDTLLEYFRYFILHFRDKLKKKFNPPNSCKSYFSD